MSVSLIHLILNKLLVSMVIVLMETIATIVNVLLALLELTVNSLVRDITMMKTLIDPHHFLVSEDYNTCFVCLSV